MKVLIAPLWNWNPTTQERRRRGVHRSNRTFMELKLRKLDAVEGDSARSNRTFMELKSGYGFICFMVEQF